MQYNLVVLRMKHKLTQRDMAKIIGSNVDSYGRKERGELQFKGDEMFAISQYFEKTMDEIFLPTNSINNAVN